MPNQQSDSPRRFTFAERLGWTLLLVVVSAFGFLYIDAHNAALNARHAQLALETPLDALVPFVPAFMFAYLLYYPWVLLPLFVLHEREPFVRAILAFGLMLVLAGTVFIVFPSHMVRPTVQGSGLAADLTRMMFRLDMGWNVFPSLHVGHSSLVAMIFVRHGRKYALPVVLGSSLISLSTVMVKQHYVVDVPAGFLLAWLCFWASQQPVLFEPRYVGARSGWRARLLRARDEDLAQERTRR